MIGLDDNLNKPKLKMDAEYIYVPLKFWFCDTIKPLPIIALQNSDIYIDVKFRDFYDCISVLEQYNSVLYHSDKKHQLFIAPENFTENAQSQPPYNTVPWYDAKLWQFFEKNNKEGDCIWNVGAVNYKLNQ